MGWSEIDSIFQKLTQVLSEVDEAIAKRARKTEAGGLRPRRREGSYASRIGTPCDQPGGWSGRMTDFFHRGSRL
jgi:hypothetical protein